MENTARRIHPLVATAAVALTVFSLAGIAAVTGLLPTSKSDPVAVSQPAGTVDGKVDAQSLVEQGQGGAAGTTSANAATAAPVQKEPHQTVARHEAPRHHDNVRDSVRAESGQHANAGPAVQTAQQSQPAQQPAPAPAAAPQNSALGIGIGAVVGGLLGNQVGGGNGKKLATVAGAIGGGFVGNEIAKRNQTPQQPPAQQQ